MPPSPLSAPPVGFSPSSPPSSASGTASSPVGAAGRVYITGRDGTTLVLRNGGKFDVIAKNVLDDGFDASPALVDGEMYMRGYRYLYSLGAK